MKVHERIMLGSVFTAASSSLVRVNFIQRRMLAGVLHIFHIAAPFQMSRFKLICDRAHVRRIDASMSNRLPIRVEPGLSQSEIIEYRTVQLRVWIGRLTAYHRDVIVKAEVPDSIVVS
ncbi:hypothetical protein [Candidatus Binatus sp.]|uniref:hypothetical protein n=1 Tax=Candidatus Binatus sp. TaxID=2811406 RepID=UPI003BAE547F